MAEDSIMGISFLLASAYFASRLHSVTKAKNEIRAIQLHIQPNRAPEDLSSFTDEKVIFMGGSVLAALMSLSLLASKAKSYIKNLIYFTKTNIDKAFTCLTTHVHKVSNFLVGLFLRNLKRDKDMRHKTIADIDVMNRKIYQRMEHVNFWMESLDQRLQQIRDQVTQRSKQMDYEAGLLVEYTKLLKNQMILNPKQIGDQVRLIMDEHSKRSRIQVGQEFGQLHGKIVDIQSMLHNILVTRNAEQLSDQVRLLMDEHSKRSVIQAGQEFGQLHGKIADLQSTLNNILVQQQRFNDRDADTDPGGEVVEDEDLGYEVVPISD